VGNHIRILAPLVVRGEGLTACAHNDVDRRSQPAEIVSEKCLDKASSAQSVAAITRYSPLYDDPHVVTVLGIEGGSIWFLKDDEPVLALHVAKSLGLSDREWTPVEIYQNERDPKIHRHQRIRARLLRTITWGHDGLAVLKLEEPFQGARPLALRAEPLEPGEKIITPAYPGGFLELTTGHFVGIDLALSNESKEGSYAIEIDDNRLALDSGASGAPVLDCTGRVVAAVSAQFYLISENGSDEATPQGQKTNEAIPVTILSDSYAKLPGNSPEGQ
jgi:trypsin-like peptidase